MKKNDTTILILGGYGSVGRTFSRLLLTETSVKIIIAGRNSEKAESFVSQLKQEFPNKHITSCYADATKYDSLIKAFINVQLVVVLTTTPKAIPLIGQAALASGCDYLDILVSDTTYSDLSKFAPSIAEQKRTFITQAGFHPGLPAVFIRSAAQYFDKYESATIAIAMNARFERAEQAAEIIPLIADFNADICVNGFWREATYKDARRIDMGATWGKMLLYPMQMAEIKKIQQLLSIPNVGVYISGFNWFVDYLVMPIIFITQKIKTGFASKLLCQLFAWGVNTFSSGHRGVVFLNEAEGVKDGKKIKIRIVAEHQDAYLFTAIAVVACVKQYLSGTLPIGLWFMGHAVDDKQLLDDLEKMQVHFDNVL